ncbi:MAG: helix-turn-helix transcriptional regulator [Marmoricola sp.]
MGQDLSRDHPRDQPRELPMTSYALLGLLTFGEPLTGYELKQRADRTLRYYWVSPAMSQVYSELERLHEHGLVRRHGEDRATSYSLTRAGSEALTRWMRDTPVGFPVLKHPVALRLLLGALVDPESVTAMLRDHLVALEHERADLEKVRVSLQGADTTGQPFRYPALVADWGLSYFDHERTIIEDLLRKIDEGT